MRWPDVGEQVTVQWDGGSIRGTLESGQVGQDSQKGMWYSLDLVFCAQDELPDREVSAWHPSTEV